ncbi:hypothetical protein JXA70_03555 [candidate division KSB1 bacterium]|nr:hypothetical protein [candidate division KSB1 bacterium]
MTTAKKNTRQHTTLANLVTVMGILLILAAFVYSYAQYNLLHKQVEQKAALSDSLDTMVKSLEDSVDSIKHGPIADLVKPKALAITLPGQRDPENRQLYNFIVWIEVPHVRKSEISSVAYLFDYFTMLKKERIGREPGNGFAVNYTGWGCLETITLTIKLKNGTQTTVDFAMCDNLVIR